ncbi:MAG: hypothetical protein HRT89_19360 [Lentisphaeria bacterium]|nr:hypothetical protein [Lentisphaeria bacterium]NQZ70215.1 hypothetical protein [Lentisphaeria bacterium]
MVITPGTLHPGFDDLRAGSCHVVALNGGFRMYYWGGGSDDKYYILQAESPASDPNDWRPLGGVLLGPQADTVYNNKGPSSPFIVKVTETRWHMYYAAWGNWSKDGKLPNTTGLAISEDRGKSWQYHPEYPIIPLDRPYDAEGTGSVWVLYANGKFRMYYTSISRYYAKPEGIETGHGDTIPEIGIAYAESTDGIHWEKPLDELMIAPRGFDVTPYEYICSKPCVFYDGKRYTMWVNTFGTAYRIHRLTSDDGLNWEWGERVGPEGELGFGEPGSYDDVQRSYPTMVSAYGKLHCWFTGNGFGETGMGYAFMDED